MSPDAALEQLQLGELCRRFEMVGAVVGVSIGGEHSVAVHGVRSTANGTVVTRSTAFQVGSVTKAMTASMVAMLVADGRLSLDDPVVRHVPEFRVADSTATQAITVRHLLSHTSGFDGDVWPDLGDGDESRSRIAAGCAELAQLSVPGEGFSYSNVGYAVLGRVVECVAGMTFESAMREMIAVPAAARIAVGVQDLDTADHAVGHVRADDGWVPVTELEGAGCLAPAGSRTWAAIDDLLAFGELHLGRRSSSLQPALTSMRVPQIRVADPNNGGDMALGMFLDDRWGSPVVFHDGGMAGQSAYLRILPERDAVLAVMSTGGVPQTFHRHVFSSLGDTFLGLRAPMAVQPDPSVVIDPARVAGTYEAAGSMVEIRIGDDGLQVQCTWRYGGEPFPTGWLPASPANERVLLVPYGGRDLVVVLPPAGVACDHVLHGLRRVNRVDTL